MRRAKVVMVLCGALHGLGATLPLHALLAGIAEAAREHEKPLLALLGMALNCLCTRPSYRSDMLQGLVEQSGHWPLAERDTFHRWLAQRSRYPEVRRTCLQALLGRRSSEQ